MEKGKKSKGKQISVTAGVDVENPWVQIPETPASGKNLSQESESLSGSAASTEGACASYLTFKVSLSQP